MPREIGETLISVCSDKRFNAPGFETAVCKCPPFRLWELEPQNRFDIGPALHAALVGTPKPVCRPHNESWS